MSMRAIAISCFYSDKTEEILLEGTRGGLKELADLLITTPPVDTSLLLMEGSSGFYDRALKTLTIARGDGKVGIVVRGDSLNVSGSAEFLRNLGQNILFVSTRPEGEHLHLEYHPDHFYLSPESQAMVVSLRG